MPVRDRYYYIHKYNLFMEEKSRAMQGDNSSSTTDISKYTSMSQGLTDEDLESELMGM